MRSPGSEDIAALKAAFGPACRTDVPLSEISRWKIGGMARLLLEPRGRDELARMRLMLSYLGLAQLVIGSTTNLLFADAGLSVATIRIGSQLGAVDVDGDDISVEAGHWVPFLARRAMKHGLTGIEHVAGIPGTLGGLICMNGGSQRRGIGEAIVSVETLDARGSEHSYAAADCGFAYRTSRFQQSDEVIVRAHLRLSSGEDALAVRRGRIRREMLDIMGNRRRKFPHRLPNCGSVFVSNPAMYADYGPPGAIIEKLGFKGRKEGGALVSPQHANFIVNAGGARALDVLTLVSDIKARVFGETGYDMAVEARYIHPDGTILPADGRALKLLNKELTV